MGRQRYNISVGDKFGELVVIGEAPRDEYNHIRYRVRCSCGKELIVPTGRLKKIKMCGDCDREYRKVHGKGNLTGQIINGWEIIGDVIPTKSKARQYICKCTRCGNIAIKTKGSITRKHTAYCSNCPADYRFEIKADVARGILPSGEEFIIDAEDVEKVSKYHWHRAKGNYIARGDKKTPVVMLHQYLIENESDDFVIDHINRNRFDCRKSNLRIVTHHQNSMNRSLARNNTSGYVGVSYVKSQSIYRAQISMNSKDIRLGSSKDPVECAQMYNVASRLLYGEYAGHKNDVPDPPDEMIQTVIMKCQPYLAEAVMATQPCGYF